MSICRLSGELLFLLFLLLSPPPHDPLLTGSPVDRGEIKAPPLEESEYFRCAEKSCVSHHLCGAQRRAPPPAQPRLAGPLGPGDTKQGHLSESGSAPLPSSYALHFHFTAFEPKINESK